MSWKHQMYLHIYAQHTNHQESFIVGNKQALLKLRDLIDEALVETTAAEGSFFSSDDEGYEVYVGLVKNEEVFQSLEMPYTEQFGDRNDQRHFINLKNDPNAPYDPIILFKETKQAEE